MGPRLGEQGRKRNKKSLTLDLAQELDLFFFFPREIFLQKCIKNQKQPFRVKLSQRNMAIFSEQTKKIDQNRIHLKTKKTKNKFPHSRGNGQRAFVSRLVGAP